MTIKFSLPTASNLAINPQSNRTEQIRARLEAEDEDEIDPENIPGANKGKIQYKRHFAQPSYSADEMDMAKPIITPATTPLSFVPRAVIAQESNNRRRNGQSFEPEPYTLRHLIKREDDVEMGEMDEMLVAAKMEEEDEDAPRLPTQVEEMSRGGVEEPEWLHEETEDGITFYLPRSRHRRNRRPFVRPEVDEELVGEEMEVKVEDRVTSLGQHTLGVHAYQRAKEAAKYHDLRYQVKTAAPLNPSMPASLRSVQSPITSLLPPKLTSKN